jgi:hypothetical protein
VKAGEQAVHATQPGTGAAVECQPAGAVAGSVVAAAETARASSGDDQLTLEVEQLRQRLLSMEAQLIAEKSTLARTQTCAPGVEHLCAVVWFFSFCS